MGGSARGRRGRHKCMREERSAEVREGGEVGGSARGRRGRRKSTREEKSAKERKIGSKKKIN